MRDLASRQLDRCIRKAEHALAEGMLFDTSRRGIGKVDSIYNANAEAINEATEAAIARTADAIGAMPVVFVPETMPNPNAAQKWRLAGV